MYQQPARHALRTEDLAFHLDRSADTAADEKINIHDLFATVGHVASALGACGLLHAIFI